ncbi:hypothetical protein C8D79_1901 [Bacteriovorax stolpii]|nr:hypothetical protein C8D79_1901 [Bacteriovorax stolpii]
MIVNRLFLSSVKELTRHFMPARKIFLLKNPKKGKINKKSLQDEEDKYSLKL